MTTFKSTFLAKITLFYYVIKKSIKIYSKKKFASVITLLINAITRGGVENTRLEANAKETKKIRGQEPTFQAQTLSRPSTGMLEASGADLC